MKKLLFGILLIPFLMILNSCSEDDDNGNGPGEVSYGIEDFEGCWEATEATINGENDPEALGTILSINEDLSGFMQLNDEDSEAAIRLIGDWLISEENNTIEFVGESEDIEVEGVLSWEFTSASMVVLTIVETVDGEVQTSVATFEKTDCPADVVNSLEFDLTHDGTTSEIRMERGVYWEMEDGDFILSVTTEIDGKTVELLLEEYDGEKSATILIDDEFFITDNLSFEFAEENGKLNGTFEFQGTDFNENLVLVRNGSFSLDINVLVI